jgi:hypothetical protein
MSTPIVSRLRINELLININKDDILANSRCNINMPQIEQLILNKFENVQILQSIIISYSNDPFEDTNNSSIYAFVDFTSTSDLLNADFITDDNKLRMRFQDKSINLMKNSTWSRMRVNERININLEKFTGNEKESLIGYRDQYVEFM